MLYQNLLLKYYLSFELLHYYFDCQIINSPQKRQHILQLSLMFLHLMNVHLFQFVLRKNQ